MFTTNNKSDFIDIFHFVSLFCFDPYRKLAWELLGAAGLSQWSLPMHLFLSNITYPLVLVLFPKFYIITYPLALVLFPKLYIKIIEQYNYML